VTTRGPADVSRTVKLKTRPFSSMNTSNRPPDSKRYGVILDSPEDLSKSLKFFKAKRDGTVIECPPSFFKQFATSVSADNNYRLINSFDKQEIQLSSEST